MANVLSISRSLPSHSYSQSHFTDEIAKLFPADSYDPKRLAKFHASVSVSHRQLALPITEVASWGHNSFTERNDAFIKYGLELIERASRSALYKAGIKADEIDHVFYVSSTGCSNPSMDIRLLNRFEDEYDPDQALGPNVGSFRRTVSRTSIFGVGCAGGGTILNRVSDYLSGHPNKVALAISLEPFSLTTQYSDTSLANLIGTGLFGDASAAIVLAGDGFLHRRKMAARRSLSSSANGLVSHSGGSSWSPTLYSPPTLDTALPSFASKPALRPKIIAGRSFFHRDTEDKIGWDIGSFGFKLILAKDVGTIIKANILRDANSFLVEHREESMLDAEDNPSTTIASALVSKAKSLPTSVDDLASFVVHPGGPALLDKVAECFSIVPPATKFDETSSSKPIPKPQQSLKGMELSWQSLEDVGNCSSTSVMMILEDTIKTTVPGTKLKSSLNLKEGDYSLLIGFGPGFCVEMSLMEWVST